ncbi:MAG: hypothetical protein ABI462_14705 [Ignavibacteria bacterium]
MLNSKLIAILKTFSNEELKRFGEFLNSPFHNKNKKAILLFRLLSEFHPEYNNKDLTKEKLYSKVFAEAKNNYNDASLRNLLSDLIVLSEKFLAHYTFEKDRFEFNEKSLRELIDRKLTVLFDKKLKLAEESFQSGEFEGEQQYYKKFVVEELRSSGSQFADNLKLYKDESNLKASEYLSYFYLIKIFKLINFFQFQKQYNLHNEFAFAENLLSNLDLEKVMQYMKDNVKNEKDFLILSVYYKMYKTISEPADEKFYYEYKKALAENENLFSLLERYGLYVCLNNSGIMKIDLGNEKFFKECFEIYITMGEKDLYSAYSGYFPLSAYTGIVNTGLAANEFKKTEEIIYSYSDKLNPDYKEAALNHSLAQLNFYLKNYERALEFINKTDTEFSHFKFHIKILLLKIYFEKEDYDSLYYTIDSFKHFLGKNKLVGETYKKEFGSFIKILDLIVKYRSLKDKKIYFNIKQLLENKAIASRRWLASKFGELDK